MNYVMSDIHGDDAKFFEMLSTINLSQDDMLYILGDVVDHGKSSLLILDYIMQEDNIVLLKGNHELFLQYYLEGNSLLQENYIRWGGKKTILELEGCDVNKKREYAMFLRKLPIYLELKIDERSYFLTHSGFVLNDNCVLNADGSINLSESIEMWCNESEFKYLISKDIHHISPKIVLKNTVIVGHVPVQKIYGNSIFFGENIIDIDCGVSTFAEGKLACLRLEDMKEYYVG